MGKYNFFLRYCLTVLGREDLVTALFFDSINKVVLTSQYRSEFALESISSLQE